MEKECTKPACFNPLYATGLCRKHYDWERRGRAAPRHIKKCSVGNCDRDATASGLCNTHYHRKRLHGTTVSSRPEDWGAREAHPLYQRWSANRRKPHRGQQAMVSVWHNDFWSFVKDVGDPPEGCSLYRIRNEEPLGPVNFYWKKRKPASNKAAYMKQWGRENPRKVMSIDLKKRYGITLEEYEKMSEAQGGVCRICGEKNKTKNRTGEVDRLVVDHCHDTGKIRGLLCHPCNRGIGLLKDDVTILRAAIAYLK